LVRLLVVVAVATGAAVLLDHLAHRPAAFGFYVVGALVLFAGSCCRARTWAPVLHLTRKREQRVRLSFSYVLAGFVILAVAVAVDAVTH
jgi:hypothetical protein